MRRPSVGGVFQPRADSVAAGVQAGVFVSGPWRHEVYATGGLSAYRPPAPRVLPVLARLAGLFTLACIHPALFEQCTAALLRGGRSDYTAVGDAMESKALFPSSFGARALEVLETGASVSLGFVQRVSLVFGVGAARAGRRHASFETIAPTESRWRGVVPAIPQDEGGGGWE